MPRRNETGPIGMGPRTGRWAGFCAGFAAPGYVNSVDFGCGFSGFRGFRRMFYATGMPGYIRFGYPAYTGVNEASADEKEFLSRQAEFLENQLQQVKKSLSTFKENDE